MSLPKRRPRLGIPPSCFGAEGRPAGELAIGMHVFAPDRAAGRVHLAARLLIYPGAPTKAEKLRGELAATRRV